MGRQLLGDAQTRTRISITPHKCTSQITSRTLCKPPPNKHFLNTTCPRLHSGCLLHTTSLRKTIICHFVPMSLDYTGVYLVLLIVSLSREHRALLRERCSRRRSALKYLDLQIKQFSCFFNWVSGDSCLLLGKIVWKFGDSREIFFESYEDSRENLFEILSVVMISSPISFVRGRVLLKEYRALWWEYRALLREDRARLRLQICFGVVSLELFVQACRA